MRKNKIAKFNRELLRWHKLHRRNFLWRSKPTPYNVLVAEVLLQQTNAEKVDPVYRKFIAQFPNIQSLSKANLGKLKNIIKPLGLLNRAGKLKDMAQQIAKEFNGKIPNSQAELLKLKGVGFYTANAVMCFAFGKRYPIYDTNVAQVLTNVFGAKELSSRARTDKLFWELSDKILPKEGFAEFNLALLDYSALVLSRRRKNHLCKGLYCSGSCLTGS
jgi:A/G-specific adenine glycosylase